MLSHWRSLVHTYSMLQSETTSSWFIIYCWMFFPHFAQWFPITFLKTKIWWLIWCKRDETPSHCPILLWLFCSLINITKLDRMLLLRRSIGWQKIHGSWFLQQLWAWGSWQAALEPKHALTLVNLKTTQMVAGKSISSWDKTSLWLNFTTLWDYTEMLERWNYAMLEETKI